MSYLTLNLNALFFLCTIIVVTVCNSLGNESTSVIIFLEESNSDVQEIVLNAVHRYSNDHKHGSLENQAHLNFSVVSYNRIVNDVLTMNQDHSASIRFAVFLYVSSHERVLSSIMKGLNIVAIGLFQEDEIPTTQENYADFTRVASPSMMHYACAFRDMVQKMGWRRLSLVVSADYEGKVLADAILAYSKTEKWHVQRTVWISRGKNAMELKTSIKLVVTSDNDNDAVIVHIRDSHNEDFFRLVQILGVNQSKASWLLTDITTQGVSDSTALPTGFVTISPWRSPEHDFMEHALYDTFDLIGLSVSSGLHMNLFSSAAVVDPQELIKQKVKGTFFQGKTSLFENPALSKGPFSTMDISNLKQDLDGQKHWWSIGLRTYSGIALEAFNIPSGKVVNPLAAPSKPTVRVPVVLYPPWIEFEEPQYTLENHMTCIKRGYFCYNKTGITVSKLCCFGFSIDLLKNLERELGFIPEIYFVADGQDGSYGAEENGKWNGIVNELVNGRGDLALGLAMTEKRAQHIAFSFPYLPLALNVLVEKGASHKTGVQWYSWLKPFDVALWLMILGTCNVILLVIWWLDRKSPRGYYRILKESNEYGFTMLDAMSYVWGVAFSKDIGAEKTPRSTSARFVSTVYAFMAMVIVNTYCANLMAFLVQDHFVLPIDSIRDPKLRDVSLHPPDGFQLGMLQGSISENYFRNHVNYDYRQIYNSNLKLNLLDNFSEGVLRLQNGEIHGLVGDYLSLRQIANKMPDCSLCMAGPNFYTYGLAFAMPKNSPWLDDITRVVLEMKENGSISMLEKTYFDENLCRSSIAKESLSIFHFSGLFLTVAGTIAFCFLALLTEVITIFVLVRFSQHLGALGKFSMRLLFDLKRGEEHLITLKYSTMRNKRKRVKMDLVKIENASSSGTTVEQQRNSISTTTLSCLEEQRSDADPKTTARRTPVFLNESLEFGLTSSHIQMSFTNSGYSASESLNCDVTPL